MCYVKKNYSKVYDLYPPHKKLTCVSQKIIENVSKQKRILGKKYNAVIRKKIVKKLNNWICFLKVLVPNSADA